MNGSLIIALLIAVVIVFAIGYVLAVRTKDDEDVTDDRDAPWEEE